MKTIKHTASSRGNANHGWLNSYHTFSFSQYYHPQRMNFGLLRVLNDDTVSPGMGFGTHPHDNMEIISIPLEGDLKHKDSMGNEAIIKEGEIQVMSAGTGITHSEFNPNHDKQVKFLQIWVFPREKGVEPRYQQIQLADLTTKNTLHQVLSPNADDAGVWIHQDAWFHMGTFDAGAAANYTSKKAGHGVYAFVIEGGFEIAGEQLERRDGLGITDTDSFSLKATEEGSRILLMEVPMG